MSGNEDLGFRWYVVHTYSGYEDKVASTLETTIKNRSLHDLFEDVKVPTEMVQETVDGKTKEVKRKIYPGYVFIKMVHTDESWHIVKNIRGCTGFVGPDSKPVPLTDAEAEKMGVEARRVELPFNIGESVRIIGGYLKGQIGRVLEIDVENNVVKLSIDMLGRATTEIDLDMVDTLE